MSKVRQKIIQFIYTTFCIQIGIRSGTSVGAMVREAEHAETKKDFIHKMAIAQKEINETIYWLELMKETDYLSIEQFESMNNNAIEIIKLITSILKSCKANINN